MLNKGCVLMLVGLSVERSTSVEHLIEIASLLWGVGGGGERQGEGEGEGEGEREGEGEGEGEGEIERIFLTAISMLTMHVFYSQNSPCLWCKYASDLQPLSP